MPRPNQLLFNVYLRCASIYFLFRLEIYVNKIFIVNQSHSSSIDFISNSKSRYLTVYFIMQRVSVIRLQWSLSASRISFHFYYYYLMTCIQDIIHCCGGLEFVSSALLLFSHHSSHERKNVTINGHC